MDARSIPSSCIPLQWAQKKEHALAGIVHLRAVVALDARHRVVDESADRTLAGLGFDVLPARFGRAQKMP
jgi:hypothetical protein